MKLHLLDPLAPDLRRSWLSLLPSFEPDDDGGGSDDDEGDDDEGDDEGDDDESDDDKGKGKDDDTAKRLKVLERSLRRARSESQRWKKLANSNADKDKGQDSDDDGPDFRTAALTQAGVNALTSAGFTGTSRRAERLLATVGLDDIEPDRRGRFDPEDFADVIDELKDEFPELFRSEDDDDTDRRRRPAARNVSRSSSSNGTGGGKTLSADEKFALAIAGQAGYSSVERKIRRGR